DGPWVKRIAPFVGFILLAWIFLALQSTVHDSVPLWDWHVPEVAIGGFLIGFLALGERFARAARWAAVLLTVLILPIVVEVPYVLVPIAVIWISMFLTGKKVRKSPALVLGAVLPCLLTTPILILVGMDLATAVALLLVLVTVVALPLANVMNLPSTKRQFAAVSIVVPCIALIWAVWLILATDASLSRGMELEEERLIKIRRSLEA
ncbi:MAG: hypothetical protein IIC73_07490, partial [Armatimonadetes bacterium]|nr:hypothetical protein [Armatimonadota bacterium]